MKKIISFVLTCILLVNCFAFTAFLTETEENPGFFPGWDTKYKLEQVLEAAPQTFTAVVQFPVEYNYAATKEDGTNGPGMGGTIIGNYNGTPGTVRFSVDHGYPCLTWRDSYKNINYNDDVTLTAKFTDITTGKSVKYGGVTYDVTPMYTGEPVVVTIVRDDANEEVRCYIDGDLKQTIDYPDLGLDTHDRPIIPEYLEQRDETKLSNFVIGGDMSQLNGNYIRALNGNQVSLNKIGLFATVRTDAQVEADYNDIMNDVVPADSFAFFDFAGYPDRPETITAIKGNYTSKRLARYLSAKNDLDGQDYAFSIAFVGDTQKIARMDAGLYDHISQKTNNLQYVYKWLLENKEDNKIEFVVGLGDITDLSNKAEWKVAVPLINSLSTKYGTNYIAIQGNHDVKTDYDAAFKDTEYEKSIPTSQRMNGDSILNFYKKVNLNGVPYMFLCLEYAPSNEILAWADGIVESNKNYNVIYITHAYAAKDGSTLGRDNGTTPDNVYINNDGTTGKFYDDDGINNGEEQWHKFVKKHENICMVVSGHIGSDEIVIANAVGDNGNIVKQVLIDHQDIDGYLIEKNVTDNPKGLGVVAMMYFMGDGKTVKTDAISTTRAYSDNETFANKPYFDEGNRKTFELDLRGTKGGDFSSDTVGKPDGDCTVADVLYVIDEVLNDKGYKCDVNADGDVTLADVLRVISYINN